MKEQTQQPGVRKWAGDDMIALQAEPLSAIQGFFKEYGNCIIEGCATTPAAGGKYNIAPGLLALSGMDADGVATFKVVPFSGVENVTLPLYFTLTHSVVDRVYGDGKVKPIAYDYRAAVSAVRPAAGVEFLELTTAGARRFVDAVKITEKLDKTGNGRDVTVTFAQAATRENIASGEKLTVILGKIIRWLADLKALAFKDKVSKADMDTALQGELNGKEPGFTKNTAFNKNFGTAAGTVCQGNDARLSDSRPANGGNADTVNNRGYKQFVYVNPALNIQANDIWPGSFSGFGYEKNGWPTSGSFISFGGLAAEGKYVTQIQADYGGGNGIFFRTINSDTNAANPWRRLALAADIPATLPANGGNADTVGGKNASDFVQVAGNQTINGNLTVGGSVSGNVVFFNRASARKGYIGLGMPGVTDVYVYNDAGANYIRVADNGKNYSNDKEIATVDQIPTNFSQIGDAEQEFVAVGTTLRKTIIAANKTGNGYVSRVALGLTNLLSQFGPAILSVGVNDLGTEWVDYTFGIDGRISSPAGTFALTSEIKTLSGGAAPTPGQYVSGIAVNDHEITVTKAALPTSDLGGIGANGANWDTFTTPGSNWTNSMGWGTNAPNTNNMNGLLIVSRSGNCIVQCYEPSDATGAFKRVKPIDGYWSDWKQCAMKSDFNTANIAESVNKRFMSDAQEAKLDGGLEVAFAGIVDADGGILKSKGRQFDVAKNGYGLFTVTHGENDANLIVQVMSEGGTVSIAHTFTSRTFKVDSYAGAGGNTNGRGFRFVAYKL